MKLKVAAASPATHPVALAVSRCLDHEDSSVQLAALHSHGWVLSQLLMQVILPSSWNISPREFAWQQLNHCPGWKKWVEPMLVKSYTFFFPPLSEAAKRIQVKLGDDIRVE